MKLPYTHDTNCYPLIISFITFTNSNLSQKYIMIPCFFYIFCERIKLWERYNYNLLADILSRSFEKYTMYHPFVIQYNSKKGLFVNISKVELQMKILNKCLPQETGFVSVFHPPPLITQSAVK